MISALILLVGMVGAEPADSEWKRSEIGVKAKFRGVSALDSGKIFVSGSDGTVMRSEDAGETWLRLNLPGPAKLDFRDVQAIDDNVAIVMAAGVGKSSRIYKTDDGGRTWTLKYLPDDPTFFLDALAFFDSKRGLALGDPIEGRFQILRTEDAGETWEAIDSKLMPDALANEGGFAASGTCLVALKDGRAWFGTGGASVSRVFRSSDFGKSWQVSATPVEANSPSKGIFGLAFLNAREGFAIGGDYKAIAEPGRSLAKTVDGGASWTLVENRPAGFREAIGFVGGTEGKMVVAVGPSGSDISNDGGATWKALGGKGFHAAAFFNSNGVGRIIGVGDNGLIARRSSK